MRNNLNGLTVDNLPLFSTYVAGDTLLLTDTTNPGLFANFTITTNTNTGGTTQFGVTFNSAVGSFTNLDSVTITLIRVSGGSGSGENLQKAYTAANAFTVGNVVRMTPSSDNNYALAQADMAANADVVGFIIVATGTDFIVGIVRNLISAIRAQSSHSIPEVFIRVVCSGVSRIWVTSFFLQPATNINVISKRT